MPTGFGQTAKRTAARPIVRHMNEQPISVDVFGTGNGAFAATADTIIDWAACQLFARLCRIPDAQKMALLRSLCGVSQAYAGCPVLAKNLPLRPS